MFAAILMKIFALIQSFILSLLGMGGHFSSSTAVVSFDANPSTGYSWVCEMEPEGVVEIEKEYYTPAPVPPGTVGSGGLYTFVIAPVADGETTLTFYYMRAWEGKDSAAEVVSYDVTVTDGMIEMGEAVYG